MHSMPRDVLLRTLEELGKRVCIDYRDFSAGSTIMDNISHSIQTSRVTIFVLSPSYLESQWCHYEIRQALGMSLATCTAKVLPLILIKCTVPSILKHVTYLDTTCEDSQTYFAERLTRSLERADKWTKCFDGFNEETIANKVEIVLRKKEKANEDLLKARQLKRILCICITTPLVLIFLFLLYCFIMFLANFLFNFQNTDVLFAFRNVDSQSSSQKMVSLQPNPFYCRALKVKSRWSSYSETKNFDIYFFDLETENFVQQSISDKRAELVLSSKSYRSMKYNMFKGTALRSTFCANATSKGLEMLRVYNISDPIGDFGSQWLENGPKAKYYSLYSEKYVVYPGTRICSSITVTGEKPTNLVFANPGNSSLFVALRNQLSNYTFNKAGAFKSCHNTTFCELPFRFNEYEVFVVSNNSLNSDHQIISLDTFFSFYCVVRKSTRICLWISILLALLVFFLFLKYCVLGKCYRKIRKPFSKIIKDVDVRIKFMEL